MKDQEKTKRKVVLGQTNLSKEEKEAFIPEAWEKSWMVYLQKREE